MNSVITSIIPSLVDGLLAAIVAGVVIWLVQKKYEKRANEKSFYIDRMRKEEDEMYKYIKESKNNFYQFYLKSTNGESPMQIQSAVNEFIVMMQQALDMSYCNKVVLGKYYLCIQDIFNNYDSFVDNYNKLKNKDSTYNSQIVPTDEDLKSIADDIMTNFYAIDKIYFNLNA